MTRTRIGRRSDTVDHEALRLIRPTEAFLSQIDACRREFLAAGSSMDGAGPLRRYEDMAAYLSACRDYEIPERVPADRVPATQLILVCGERVLGFLQIRHELNEYLRQYAGHIGYSIRPSERRRGYAKRQLALALPICLQLGLSRVMISCEPDNVGSERTILSCGGVYDSTVFEPKEGIYLKRYWIDIPKQLQGHI